MVLFHCAHMAGFFQAISLRYQFHPDEDVTLFIANKTFCESTFAKNLIQNSIFTKIVNIPSWSASKVTCVEDIEKAILKAYDDFLEKEAINLSDFSAIYSTGDINNDFAIYLSMNKIKYTIFELTENHYLYGKHHSTIERLFNGTKYHTLIHQKYDVPYGAKNDYVTQRLRYDDIGNPHKDTLEKDRWINFLDLFNNIPSDHKKIIANCLKSNIEVFSKKQTCLVLPNSTGYIRDVSGGVEIKYHHIFYRVALDYCLDDGNYQIYVKEHPYNANHMSLHKDLDGSILFDILTPLEFYTFVEDFRIHKCVSFQTTATKKIGAFIDENIELGTAFLQNFKLVHKVFFAINFVKEHINKDTVHYAMGIDRGFLTKFISLSIKDLGAYAPNNWLDWKSVSNDSLVIVDKIDDLSEFIDGLADAKDGIKIIFLRPSEEILSQFADYIIPVQIKKTATKETCPVQLDTESFYIFCKDKAILQKIERFSIHKDYKYTELAIHAKAGIDEPKVYETDAANQVPSGGKKTDKALFSVFNKGKYKYIRLFTWEIKFKRRSTSLRLIRIEKRLDYLIKQNEQLKSQLSEIKTSKML